VFLIRFRAPAESFHLSLESADLQPPAETACVGGLERLLAARSWALCEENRLGLFWCRHGAIGVAASGPPRAAWTAFSPGRSAPGWACGSTQALATLLGAQPACFPREATPHSWWGHSALTPMPRLVPFSSPRIPPNTGANVGAYLRRYQHRSCQPDCPLGFRYRTTVSSKRAGLGLTGLGWSLACPRRPLPPSSWSAPEVVGGLGGPDQARWNALQAPFRFGGQRLAACWAEKRWNLPPGPVEGWPTCGSLSPMTRIGCASGGRVSQP